MPSQGARALPSAFTLLELLAVVAIIALLIAILVPSLDRAREQAYQVKCAGNLSGIFKGMYYYAEDRQNGNGYLPQLSIQVAEEWAPRLHGGVWFHQILPYVDVKRSRAGSREGFFRCPADEAPRHRYVDHSIGRLISTRVLDDPVGRKAVADRGSGGSGGLLNSSGPKLGPWIEPVTYNGSCDSNHQQAWIMPGDTGPSSYDAPRKLESLQRPYCWPLLTEVDNCWRFIHLPDRMANPADDRRRHYGGGNVATNGVNWLFGDGHASWHSVDYSTNALMCCFDLGGNGIIDSLEADEIRERCAAERAVR